VLTVLAPEPLGGVLEGVPTARSSGYDVTWVTWRGFYAPPGITDERYDRWVELLARVGTSPAWDEARVRNGLEPFYLVGEDFSDFVLAQVEEVRATSREIGLIR